MTLDDKTNRRLDRLSYVCLAVFIGCVGYVLFESININEIPNNVENIAVCPTDIKETSEFPSLCRVPDNNQNSIDKPLLHYSIVPIDSNVKYDNIITNYTLVAVKADGFGDYDGIYFDIITNKNLTPLHVVSRYDLEGHEGEGISLESDYYTSSPVCGYLVNYGSGFEREFPLKNFTIDKIPNHENYTIIYDGNSCNPLEISHGVYGTKIPHVIGFWK